MQGRAVSPHTHGFDAMTRGCLGGTGFAFISHTGIVQACGFLEIEAGNLRTSGYDMATVWRDSPLFGTIRNKEAYRGTCGCCEYHDVCGGCRARAYAVDGDYMTQEPQCLYQPHPEKKGQFV
jgi:radical SAM protein with 4Fe4S-binding SPASM domain